MKYLKLKNNNWVEITATKVDTRNEETNLVKTTIENVESAASKADAKKAQDKLNTLSVKDNKDFELVAASYIGGEIDKLSVEYNLAGEYKQIFI
jgi:hypothetical protein